MVWGSWFEKQKPQLESFSISGQIILLSRPPLPSCLPESGCELDGHPQVHRYGWKGLEKLIMCTSWVPWSCTLYWVCLKTIPCLWNEAHWVIPGLLAFPLTWRCLFLSMKLSPSVSIMVPKLMKKPHSFTYWHIHFSTHLQLCKERITFSLCVSNLCPFSFSSLSFYTCKGEILI